MMLTGEEMNRLRNLMAEYGPDVFLKAVGSCAEDLSDVSAEDGDPVASRWWDQTAEGVESLAASLAVRAAGGTL